MIKQEFLVNAIIKTFKGQIVTDYPCKGVKTNEATLSAYLEGSRSVNPRPIGRNKKGEI